MGKTGGPTPSKREDDGIGASVCARLWASTLIPRPSVAYPREDAPRPELMVPVMGTGQLLNLLVQGVDVAGRSHPHLYHLGRLSFMRCCSSWCVTHDPKRKVVFDAVVAVVLRYSL